jgi:biotin synthase
MNAQNLANKSLNGLILDHAEATTVLNWPDDQLLELVQAVYEVRRTFFGKGVKLHFLANIQSGLCAEDCSYCSQSKTSKAPIPIYRALTNDFFLDAAKKAVASKAGKLCLVASMRGPTQRDIDRVAAGVRQVKAAYPELRICASLGLMGEAAARELKAAGVDTYNHNVNTSESHYQEICHTHTYQDRLDTIEAAKTAGLRSCSGVIVGMGETDEDIIASALALRQIKADSIPVNFLIPIEGTPLEDQPALTPQKCLKVLALFRLLNPQAELRVAAGRELQLRSLQPLALYIVNSLFVGHYLTTTGQAPDLDYQMIRDTGFEIVGYSDQPSAPLKDQVTLLSR